jgi:hypothetical protein
MKRIWIHFTERQAAALKADSRERGLPMSEIVRRLTVEHYGLETEYVEAGRPYKSPESKLAAPEAPHEPA